MRLGLFGGSFDPVHYGHLLLAETCREAACLDQVWFIPAAISPHKQGQAVTAAAHRLQMLRLAIGGHSAFDVCEFEVARGGVSYTVDTLEYVRDRLPDAELFLLMGADSLADLPNWRRPERICQLARPLIVHRPHAPTPNLDVLLPFAGERLVADASRMVVEMPLIELSSSDLRSRIRAGLSIRYRTPRSVEQYIAAQRLYQDQA
jgi:nicotinate-nucleotide adenylyltransferase